MLTFFAMKKSKAGLGRGPKNFHSSPKGAQKGVNLENGMPIKCEQKAKCYFAFCALKSQLTTSRLPFAVLPWRCRFVLVQELLFAGCFFRFAPYGRALVGARCGYMPHKPLGTDQTAKCGKMLPVKRKQGEKCYFSPCALISKLTTSCYLSMM